jgi:7,8-dihydropterin-6-yl-methyl-4-(beta-D-ribofuranosyl)aminobenzene 5'-phosphate synthase
MEVAPGLFTTGTVPRSTGEPTGVKTFCVRDDGSCTEDPIFDDISLVAKVGDCGLSVITGCSHSGIVNILRHCTQLAGCNDLELVIGGFHLLGATDDRMSWTMSEFAAMKPSRVVSGHCTGFDAEARFRQQMGSAYESMFTGKAIRVPR